MEFLNALFTAMLDNNVVFAQLIGMVTVVLVAKRPQDAIRFGGLLAAGVLASGLVGLLTYVGLLQPWSIGYLAPVVFALVGAAAIFTVGMVLSVRKPSAERASALRLCGLLSVNAAVLSVPLANAVAADGGSATLGGMLGTVVGASLGVWLAVVLFAFVRGRIDESLVPHAMRGLPISLVTASLMALAFTCVAGIAGGLFV